jgi:hypothetical protein
MPYSDWQKCSDITCRGCRQIGAVKYRVYTSSDEGHEDYQYHCDNCGHEWWIDGIDS